MERLALSAVSAGARVIVMAVAAAGVTCRGPGEEGFRVDGRGLRPVTGWNVSSRE